MSDKIAINVNDLSKAYRIYKKRQDIIRESISIRKKTYHNLYYSLRDVSFKIKKGKMIGIIGGNGAGKSTLLKILTGVTIPSQGTVEIEGKISALLELGAGFNPNYTGVENIYLNGTMMGYSKEEMENRIQSIIDFADIGEFINQPVKNYSSGMFARLAFAVAINVDPDILIVDEALSVGDIFFQNKCFRKIEELKKKNVTILYVSHDLASIKEMCDAVLWLEKGKVRKYGQCAEVCNEYSNELLREKDNNYIKKDFDGIGYETKEIVEQDIPPIHFTNESVVSEEVNIISCYLVNSKNHITNCFLPRERCRLNVIIKSNIKIERGIIGFSIATVKGVWIINANTLLQGGMKYVTFEAGETKKIEFIFDIPNIIAGDYVFEVAINDGTMDSYKTYAWLYNVLNLKIENKKEQYALLNMDMDINVFNIKGENDV